MSTDYVIRLAGPQHVAQLPDIERAAASRFGDSLPESVLSHVTPVESLIAAQQSGLLWVALEPGGDPVGFAVASVDDSRVHLEELDVLPAHGRRGVGSALVGAVVDYALGQGCHEVTLTTFRDVPWNAPFYTRLGFELVPEDELGHDLGRRLSDEAELGLERSRRVAMRMRLNRPAASDPERGPITVDNCAGVEGPFYHGTKSELRPGDDLTPGFGSNFQDDRVSNHIYFTTLVDTAAWGAQLAAALAGDKGRGRIYVVEPLGPFEDDPNVTNKRFSGNPTRSYRTRSALRVVEELQEWEEHSPEMLKSMLDHLAYLRENQLDVIED